MNLMLKHIYDYQLIYLNPSTIRLGLKTAAWRGSTIDLSAWSRLRHWYRFGGGWKNVQAHVTRNIHGDFIAPGDWDQDAFPLDMLPVIAQLFLEGRRPEQTDEYQRFAARIEAGKLGWTKGYRSLDELDEYYGALISIFNEIRANGYRTQTEIGEDGIDEVRVCIDRHGRLCVFGGGTHRLSIAKLLRIERIPVILKRVHSAWVQEWMERSGTTDPLEAIREGVRDLETASSAPSGSTTSAVESES